MHLLIDGYNLIYAASIAVSSAKGRGLERSRLALLNFIAETLIESECPGTTVVFDAAGAPPGLPASFEHRALRVRFAKGYPNADELIEEIIREHSSPRRLTVVSSDHRIQRAAKRRRATAVDSEIWYQDALRRRSARGKPKAEHDNMPRGEPSPDEVAYWLALFDDSAKPDANAPKRENASDSIFPPGYGEDLESQTDD